MKDIDPNKCYVCDCPVEGYEPQYCCSGHECGCYGMPIEPPLCDKPECSRKIYGSNDACDHMKPVNDCPICSVRAVEAAC